MAKANMGGKNVKLGVRTGFKAANGKVSSKDQGRKIKP